MEFKLSIVVVEFLILFEQLVHNQYVDGYTSYKHIDC